MSFRISGLPVSPFAPLFALDNEALIARGMRRCRAPMEGVRMPCRVTLRFTPEGESAILLPYTHQDALTPFHASGPIFVRETARETFDGIDILPQAVGEVSLLSLRGYDDEHMIVDATVGPGTEAETLIERLLSRDDVAYIHAHFAPRGCYLARIDRA